MSHMHAALMLHVQRKRSQNITCLGLLRAPMLFSVAILALPLILLIAGWERAGPDVDEILLSLNADPNVRVDWYTISGSSESELREALNRLGPVDQFGKRRDAYTAWQVTWRWPFKGGKAQFSDTKARYEIVVTLPRWERPSAVRPELEQAWSRFNQALLRHEYNHVQHVRENYDEIESEIQRAAGNSSVLSYQEANARARRVIALIQRLDKEYDQDTLSGRTEGVLFPAAKANT